MTVLFNHFRYYFYDISDLMILSTFTCNKTVHVFMHVFRKGHQRPWWPSINSIPEHTLLYVFLPYFYDRNLP